MMEQGDKGKAKLEDESEIKQEDEGKNEKEDEGETKKMDKAKTEPFHIMHPIGEAHSNIIVYRAVYIGEHDYFYSNVKIQDAFVAVKSINVGAEAFNSLLTKANHNEMIPDHPNLLGIRPPLICKGNLCIIFPFMDLGSFRTIMANRFRDGLPEACILLALREALRGLSTIHACGQVHREVSAGHIFVNAEPRIKLAFSASVYDLFGDTSGRPSTSFWRGASICDNAAAPEVYGTDNNEYTAKANIWLIGITALELAYGWLEVNSRAELDLIVRQINQKKRLSESYFNMENNLNCFSCLNRDRQKFSKGFQDMVVSCLNFDPRNRPTADQLLQCQIFDSANYDVFYTYNLFDLDFEILCPRD